MSFDKAIMLGILIQVGRYIVEGRCRLVVIEKERKKDLFKLIELVLIECNSFLSFEGNYSNSDMCYPLVEKEYRVHQNG